MYHEKLKDLTNWICIVKNQFNTNSCLQVYVYLKKLKDNFFSCDLYFENLFFCNIFLKSVQEET